MSDTAIQTFFLYWFETITLIFFLCTVIMPLRKDKPPKLHWRLVAGILAISIGYLIVFPEEINTIVVDLFYVVAPLASFLGILLILNGTILPALGKETSITNYFRQYERLAIPDVLLLIISMSYQIMRYTNSRLDNNIILIAYATLGALLVAGLCRCIGFGQNSIFE